MALGPSSMRSFSFSSMFAVAADSMSSHVLTFCFFAQGSCR